jgi:hypothetical protein
VFASSYDRRHVSPGASKCLSARAISLLPNGYPKDLGWTNVAGSAEEEVCDDKNKGGNPEDPTDDIFAHDKLQLNVEVHRVGGA